MRPNKRLLQIVVLSITIPGVFLLLWQQVQYRRALRTNHELSVLAALMTQAAVSTPTHPDATLAAYLHRIASVPELAERLQHLQAASLGRDGWGRPLVLEAAQDRSMLRLRSCGRNGRDDQGKADDIEYEVVLPADP